MTQPTVGSELRARMADEWQQFYPDRSREEIVAALEECWDQVTEAMVAVMQAGMFGKFGKPKEVNPCNP